MVATVKARLAPPWGQHEALPEPELSPEPCPSSGARLGPKWPPPCETQGCRSVGPGGGDEFPIAHRMLPGSLQRLAPELLSRLACRCPHSGPQGSAQ